MQFAFLFDKRDYKSFFASAPAAYKSILPVISPTQEAISEVESLANDFLPMPFRAGLWSIL